MTDTLRRKPYVWASWITKLIAGEEKCWFKAWYKALHRYEKLLDPERESFLAQWTKTHDAMTKKRAARMKADDWVVKAEDEGQFTLSGKNADLGGKPDIVGIRDGQALIIDEKSGKRRESDRWQVTIYMFALPLSWLPKDLKVAGEVEYKDGIEQVERLTDARVDRIAQAMKRITDRENPPRAVPSARECERCDVAACTERYVKPTPGDARRFF